MNTGIGLTEYRCNGVITIGVTAQLHPIGVRHNSITYGRKQE
jgi:hypothetical protein